MRFCSTSAPENHNQCRTVASVRNIKFRLVVARCGTLFGLVWCWFGRRAFRFFVTRGTAAKWVCSCYEPAGQVGRADLGDGPQKTPTITTIKTVTTIPIATDDHDDDDNHDRHHHHHQRDEVVGGERDMTSSA